MANPVQTQDHVDVKLKLREVAGALNMILKEVYGQDVKFMLVTDPYGVPSMLDYITNDKSENTLALIEEVKLRIQTKDYKTVINGMELQN